MVQVHWHFGLMPLNQTPIMYLITTVALPTYLLVTHSDMVFQPVVCTEELFQEKTSQAATEQMVVQNTAHATVEQTKMLKH
jgi:type II secretory pathway component PulC